jgi:hypothetical protein
MRKRICGVMCLALFWASASLGMIQAEACHTNMKSETCEEFIRGYTYERLFSTQQEFIKKGDEKAYTDKIILACHRAVSVNNLIRKIQRRLAKSKQANLDVKARIDDELDYYLTCRRDRFGLPTARQ